MCRLMAVRELLGTGQSDLNYPLIRYADVLLMYAEAQNEVSGPNGGCRRCIKRDP